MNLKSVFKNINLLNILLIGFIFLLLLYVFYPMFNHSISFVLPSPSQKKTEISDLPEERLALSPADYLIIGDENLFHPERKVPLIAQTKDEKQLSKPEFFLYGTLITDDTQIAYVEDIKDPVSTPGRGKRQTALRVGDSMGGYNVKEIHSDRILMTRGEDTITLSILDSKKPRTSVSGGTTQPQTEKTKSAVRSPVRKNRTTRARTSSRAPRMRKPSSNPIANPSSNPTARPQAKASSNERPVSFPRTKPSDNVVPRSHTESVVFDFFDKQASQ